MGKPAPAAKVTDNYDPVYENDKTVGVLVSDSENSQTLSGQPA